MKTKILTILLFIIPSTCYSSMVFTPSNSNYISVDTSNITSIFNNGIYSYSLWANFNDLTGVQVMLYSASDTTIDNTAMEIFEFTSPTTSFFEGTIQAVGGLGGFSLDISSNVLPITANTWYFLVHSINLITGSGTMFAYGPDGVRHKTTASSLLPFSVGNINGIEIGAGISGSPTVVDFTNGQIDDVRFFNYLLTDVQVENLYRSHNRSLPIYGSISSSTLLGYYPLDDTSTLSPGSMILDNSPAHRNGIVHGTGITIGKSILNYPERDQ